MILVPPEAFSKILLSHGGIKFSQDLVPGDRCMLDHETYKALGWPGEIAVISCHPTYYRINKWGYSLLD